MMTQQANALANPILTIQNLNAGYGKLHILHDIDLLIPEGQFAAILGPNGSGKSTLLKTVFGLTNQLSGSIHIDNRALDGVPTDAIVDYGISYVPQRSNIFAGMSVRENLLLGVRNRSRTEASQMLDEVYALFPILTARQSQRAGQMSGGERQMLAIALGWLQQPKVMMLDEPSAGLAPLIVTEVFQMLRDLCNQGITMIVVEQNARSILRWCDYAYILRDGHFSFHGTAEELLADEETVKGYLGVGRKFSN